uniref:hypothetical protein n=1 Tax=Ningiella ruwaisensis TaxID=2364274 RepID=UPI001F4FDFB6|nr:hypothetical protein [Ningiella ruwaisensis]
MNMQKQKCGDLAKTKHLALTQTTKTYRSLVQLCMLAIVSLGMNAPSLADDNILSLSNLERERAALINDLLNPALDIEQRIARLDKRERQLTDMERMVIRDERLLNSNHHLVKRAFANYELTFLVHAGAESKQNATSQWLKQVSFDSQDIFKAKAGYR